LEWQVGNQTQSDIHGLTLAGSCYERIYQRHE
jgi:hypothetical protein